MRWGGRSAAADGIDLRSGWREVSYCAIDVETTGLDLRRDSIVSIGSVGISAGRIVCRDSYYSLIRPACPISVASMRIHCLRPVPASRRPRERVRCPGRRPGGSPQPGRPDRDRARSLDRTGVPEQAAPPGRAPVRRTCDRYCCAGAGAGLRSGRLGRPGAVSRAAGTAARPARLRAASRAGRRGYDCGRVSRPGHQGGKGRA